MASRFELKYLIPERVALQVRAFVQQHLEVDEFGVGKADFSYPVHSLYLDSDDWEIHRRTVNGDKNRFKLRIRYYNENPRTPVFFFGHRDVPVAVETAGGPQAWNSGGPKETKEGHPPRKQGSYRHKPQPVAQLYR